MDYIIKIKREKVSVFKSKWIWKLAYKDARKNFSRLFLFISSIVIGIGALVAIDSFNINLQNDINKQAKELLGADLVINSRGKKFEKDFISGLDSLNAEFAEDARFASMVFFSKTGGTRLIQVIAMEGDFPFYGEIALSEDSDIESFNSKKSVMIDESLAIQYSVEINDTIKLGKASFLISGFVTGFPGNTNISAAFAPVVYLPLKRLEETGLIQYGSRVSYNKYLKLIDGGLEEIKQALNPEVKKYGYSYETIESRRENLGQGFENLYKFFNLLSFVALILGCIGVASSVYIYVKEKKYAAAVLRCMGASGWQIFYVFFIQILTLGILGSILGVIHGILLQYILPLVVSDFIPIEVTPLISWISAFQGLLVGLIISSLFSILPLINI